MFSRLTRWLDRLIPFDFQIEHKPGAKIGLADYLSRHPSREATPISTYDNMYTVAKINLIRAALGFNDSSASRGYKSSNYQSKRPNIKAEKKQSINRLKVSSRDEPVAGGKPCERKSTNQNRTHGLNRRQREIRSKLVGAITQSKKSCLDLSNSKFQNSEPRTETDRNMKKWQKVLKQHPSLNSSSNEMEQLPQNIVSLEAITKETKSVRANTTFSLSSAFTGETIPPVDPNSICMSIIPRYCKIVNKITSLPDLFNLKFIKSYYVSDPQLSAIRDLIVSQEPNVHEKNYCYEPLLFPNGFYVKENVV